MRVNLLLSTLVCTSKYLFTTSLPYVYVNCALASTQSLSKTEVKVIVKLMNIESKLNNCLKIEFL